MPHASRRKSVVRIPKRLAPSKAPGLAPVRKRQEEEWDASKLITVRRDGAEWRLLPSRLREWKATNAGRGER